MPRKSLLLALAASQALASGAARADVAGALVDIINSTAAAIVAGRLSPIGADIVGVPTIIDGDTIEIHGERVRLLGIDAPEHDQPCMLEGDVQWRCGQDAAFALAGRIARSHVRCRPYDRDLYNRFISICYLGGEDLNRWMVRHGWAVAYLQFSEKYAHDENYAEDSRLGIWASSFEQPWLWRRSHE